ncbi:MAG: zinc ribbon domain-containing protein [Syntrophomonadaceae bacterium]|nr:zinc ribbon domain-containing protein [Syntrophomonadaceae bacterium]
MNNIKVFSFTNVYVNNILGALSKLYGNTNIPFAAAMTAFFTVCYFARQEGGLYLLIAGILVAASFALNIAQELIIGNRGYTEAHGTREISAGNEFGAALKYIEIYHEIENQKKAILSAIRDGQMKFEKHDAESMALFQETGKAIGDYITTQSKEAEELLKVKSEFERLFGIFNDSAKNFSGVFEDILKKLSSSGISLEYYGYGNAALDDIKNSFRALYAQNAVTETRQVQEIIDRLNITVMKIASLQDFPKAYRDSISLLSKKIEGALANFNAKNESKKKELSTLCNDLFSELHEQYARITNIDKSCLAYFARNNYVMSKVIDSYNTAGVIDVAKLTSAAKPKQIRKKFCDLCGAKIEEGQNACPSCGESAVLEAAGE